VRKDRQHGKLATSWDELYRISSALGKVVYLLEDLVENIYLRFLNVIHLKFYFN